MIESEPDINPVNIQLTHIPVNRRGFTSFGSASIFPESRVFISSIPVTDDPDVVIEWATNLFNKILKSITKS